MSEVLEKKKTILKAMQGELPALSASWSNYRWVARRLDCPGYASWETLADKTNDDEVVRAVLQKYGELLGPPDVLDGRYVTSDPIGPRNGRKNNRRHFHAYQVEKGVPVYGATLLILADAHQGLYRALSGFWHEVRVTSKAETIDQKDLGQMLLERLDLWKKKEGDPQEDFLDSSYDPSRKGFPLLAPPELYLCWNEKAKEFHPAYHVRAIQPREWTDRDGRKKSELCGVVLMIDAVTGTPLWEAPTLDAASPTVTMKGLSSLAGADGSNIERPLLVSAEGDKFQMVNRTHDIPIYTFKHKSGKSMSKVEQESDFKKRVDFCEAPRTSGFTRTSRSMKATERDESQQPEVDAHFYAEEAYNYYETLGWSGFDDERFGRPGCPVQIVVHTGLRDGSSGNFFKAYTSEGGTRHLGFISFCDGMRGNGEEHGFYASDPVEFAHEYQHAITHFAVVNAAKKKIEPGYLDNDENGWFGAIKEGLSDAFAGLRTGIWTIPTFYPRGAIRKGKPYRKFDFPRCPETKGEGTCDHFDDVVETSIETVRYHYSSLISHLAFLLGEGGIHQRTRRKSALIPVSGIGLHRTAEILMHALPSFNQLAGKDGKKVMLKAADYFLSAAKDISGSARSIESVMMRRALYAMGLHPFSDYAFKKQPYGGETCMLPWTHAWRLSRPYLGFQDIRWGSPDLFVNNGRSACNAEIGRENPIFARVRNIGDEGLEDVEIRFFYSPIGTNVQEADWRPCKDGTGENCNLRIPSLAAGSMTAADLNCPHSFHEVQWKPEEASLTGSVRHFSLRADLKCAAANHQNDVKYRVQSSIIVLEASRGEEVPIAFYVSGGPAEPDGQHLRSSSKVRLEWELALPEEYRLECDGDDPSILNDIPLKAGQSMVMRFKLRCPDTTEKGLVKPYEGRVTARLTAPIDGQFLGELSGVKIESSSHGAAQERGKRHISLAGLLSGHVWEGGEKIALLQGGFEGKVDPHDGSLNGILACAPGSGEKITLSEETWGTLDIPIRGSLEPFRAIHFTQFIGDDAVGGVTVIVKEPEPAAAKGH